MTTIAYTAGVIAADTFCGAGTNYIGDFIKIARVGGVLFGASGYASEACAFLRAAAAGELQNGKLFKDDGDGQSGRGISIDGAGLLTEYDSDGHHVIIPAHECYAIGSGKELAIGAMLSGASAPEAVLAAGRLDRYTGRLVLSIPRHTGVATWSALVGGKRACVEARGRRTGDVGLELMEDIRWATGALGLN